MEQIDLFHRIADLGILIVIAGIFLKLAIGDRKDILSILKNIESVIVNNNLNKEQYEQMLVFKYKNITRSLVRKIGEYIIKNNIVSRYEAIKYELYQNVKTEMINFKYLMESMTDKDTFKRSYDYLETELKETTESILFILQELKKEHDYNKEKDTIRLILVEIDTLENKLISFAQDI